MKKEELEKRIDDVLKSIKDNCKDEKLIADKLDELLSLKGQLDVEPVRLCVEEKNVVKEYDFGSYRYLRCKGGILYQTLGGFSIYVTPRVRSLYEHLNTLLSLKDEYDTLSDELKESYDALLTATQFILSAPTYVTVKDEAFFGLASDIATRLNDMAKDLLDQPLQDETPVENADFENTQDLLNNITK